jgi:hypothetical protein
MINTLLSFLAPIASAAGVDQIGAGAPGIDEMWGTIRATFPFTDIGAGGVTFISMKIVAIILSTISAVAVIMIIYGGIKMIVSGSEEGFTEAKKLVMYTSAGLICAMLADGIVIYVITLLNQVAGS